VIAVMTDQRFKTNGAPLARVLVLARATGLVGRQIVEVEVKP
jgi:hypothetical protein